MTYTFPITILLASLGVYLNALSNDFVMDDYHLILENHYLKSFSHIPDIFLTNVLSYIDVQSSLYRPLAHLTWMVCYHIFGLTPWGFHLVNVLYHAGVSLLVYFITLRLVRRVADSNAAYYTAWLVAGLFAVHPIHTEAVTWVAACMDLSYTFFVLLAFYLYMRSTEGAAHSWPLRYMSVLCFFLSTLSKEPALTFPLVLILHDYTFRRNDVRFGQCLRWYAPYFAVVGIYLAMRTTALGGFAPVRSDTGLTAFQYVVNVTFLFGEYLAKLLAPVNLNNWYVFRPIDSILTPRGLSGALTVVVFSILLIVTHRKSPIAFFGLWLIVIPLLPSLYLPALTQGLEHAFAERYLYLSSFGFLLVLGEAARGIWARGAREAAIISVCLATLFGTYAIGTIQRNAVWRDSRSLWSDARNKSPNDPEPYNVLGDVLRLANKPAEAIPYYETGLRLRHNSPHIHANLGTSYAKLGQTDRAIQHFEEAIRLRPGYADAYNNLGVVFIETGQIALAIRHFQTALKLRPTLATAAHNLGLVMSSIGESDRAVEHYQNALRIDPDYADAHVSLGVAYGEKGRLDEAMGQFRAALRLNPNDVSALQNMANAYRLKGLNDRAEEYIRKAEALRRETP